MCCREVRMPSGGGQALLQTGEVQGHKRLNTPYVPDSLGLEPGDGATSVTGPAVGMQVHHDMTDGRSLCDTLALQ